MDAVAFMRVFINQIERPQPTASLCIVTHKVPDPGMVLVPRLLRQPRGAAPRGGLIFHADSNFVEAGRVGVVVCIGIAALWKVYEVF